MLTVTFEVNPRRLGGYAYMPGFRPDGLTTFFVGLPPGSYPDIDRQAIFFQNAIEKLKTLPGVTAASAGSNLPAINCFIVAR